MTDHEIKETVRARDGYKCVRCGKTNDEHTQETGKKLDVHRIIPGCNYRPDLCITVCRECHNKLPRNCDGVFFRPHQETGVAIFFLNLHDEKDKRIYDFLLDQAAAANLSWSAIMDRILLTAIEACRDNYVI